VIINLADGAANPHLLAMKPRDIRPNKRDIHLLVYSHSTHKNIKPTCNQIRNKYRWDETLNTTPTTIWAILLVVCRLLHSNHPTPTGKHLIYIFSRWDVVCLCIHWVVQNTKHPFLIYAGSVYTTCVLFLFFSWVQRMVPFVGLRLSGHLP